MIVLLGASGYVGQAYQQFFRRENIPFLPLARAQLDYANTTALTAFLREQRATFLINAAGYTGKPNVDACELQKAECLFGNAILPARIAAACADAKVPWGHVSSGCIYTGAHPDGSGFSETDAPNFSFRTNNCSFYSGTKALGEEVLLGTSGCFQWRLRIPFNEVDNPRNYLTKLMRYDRLLDARNSISQLDEFVAGTFRLWTFRAPFGVYNVTNPGSITAREIVALIQRSGRSNKSFEFFNSETEFMRVAAKTPRSNCVMDTAKLERAGVRLTPVFEAVEKALRDWRTE